MHSLEKTDLINKKFLFHFFNLNPYFTYSVGATGNEFWIQTTPKKLLGVLRFLKKHSLVQFQSLIDIIVYDEPGEKYRFTIIYSLLSLKFNNRIQIALKVHELQSIISVSGLYKSALWAEREIWDLYGIFFLQHCDLRRILTDYNFSGHPLRKDFPLSGYIDLFYDDKQKRIVYVPIEITQEYRNFNFQSPWR